MDFEKWEKDLWPAIEAVGKINVEADTEYVPLFLQTIKCYLLYHILHNVIFITDQKLLSPKRLYTVKKASSTDYKQRLDFTCQSLMLACYFCSNRIRCFLGSHSSNYLWISIGKSEIFRH